MSVLLSNILHRCLDKLEEREGRRTRVGLINPSTWSLPRRRRVGSFLQLSSNTHLSIFLVTDVQTSLSPVRKWPIKSGKHLLVVAKPFENRPENGGVYCWAQLPVEEGTNSHAVGMPYFSPICFLHQFAPSSHQQNSGRNRRKISQMNGQRTATTLLIKNKTHQ